MFGDRRHRDPEAGLPPTARSIVERERARLDGGPARPAARPGRTARRGWRRPRTPEEEAYRQARTAANRRIAFLFHLVPYLATCMFLLMVAGFRAAMAVAFAWGIGVAMHGFAVLAPTLRQRWIDAEVRRRLQGTVREERQSLASEHVRALEELSASIAHEIRNPITAAKSLVQQLGEDSASPANVEYARVALEELDRVERSISHLLRYAREQDLRPVETDLCDVLGSALEALRDRIAQGGVRVERDVDAPLPLRADPEKLRRVMFNLLGNALDAMAGAGTRKPSLRISAGENLAGTEVWLRVRDNGPGMDEAARERAFQPFETSKREGTGLGLSITRKLVEAHGGSIELVSSPGVGTEFTVVLPRGGPEARREPVPDGS